MLGAQADGTACNDGDACTQTDTCQAGVCVGNNPVVCAAGSTCLVGACVPSACLGKLELDAVLSLPAGDGPTSVAAGDLNGDGKIDLAVANGGGNNVSVLINQGNGTFAAPVNYAAGAPAPNSAGSRACGRATVGSVGSPRCARIFFAVAFFVIAASRRRRPPPHLAQGRTSTA